MDSLHKKLLEDLDKLGTWHHRINLGDGVFTTDNEQAIPPERKWKRFEPYIPEDLSGKSVLDLGANSGYYSVLMKKRGASRVVCVDNSDTFIKQAKFLSKWFDVELEIIKRDAHVYCLTTQERFDYVIFFGVFYHLKYPVLVLDRLAEMTKSRLYFKSQIIDSVDEHHPKENYSNEELKLAIQSENFPKMFFIERKFNNSASSWWVPNEAALTSLLKNTRLKIIARVAAGEYVCEAGDNTYGKVTSTDKLVFPLYGKEKQPYFDSIKESF